MFALAARADAARAVQTMARVVRMAIWMASRVI